MLWTIPAILIVASSQDFSTALIASTTSTTSSKIWSLNVTDRTNTPPEPQYTAVKVISTQTPLCKGLVLYIATFLAYCSTCMNNDNLPVDIYW